MPVPNTFANATATIPLSQLDANFATTITLGNTAIQLGNTVTTLNNMTLANVTVSSGNVTITNVTVTTANVTTANIATAQIANVTVSGTGTFAAGSNTAPSITTSGDTNTGIFFPAADTIAFTEGGVESMRIDSSGNVGIGTSSPKGVLDVTSAGAYVPLFLTTTNTANSLQRNWMISTSWNLTGDLSFVTSNAIGGNPVSAGTTRMMIDAVGNVGIGTISPATLLHVNGTIRYTNRPAAGTITAIGYDANGDLKNSSSSLRYKYDIEDYSKGLDTVMQLRPVSFKFNGEERANIGFIAEEVDALGLPEVMLYNEEEQPEGVLYANMVSLLTKAIQELNAKVEAQAAEIAALKAQP